jgi:hypothetical protein
MPKPSYLQLGRDLVGTTHIQRPIRQPISTADDAMSTNLDERDRLRIAGLESNRCACGDIQSETVRLHAIKVQLWVRLDEMVMRSDLAIITTISIARSQSLSFFLSASYIEYKVRT